MESPRNPQVQPLSHMAYGCPGLTGPGSRMDIKPITFKQLFSSTLCIIIPLMQRTYCWNDELIGSWWRDAAMGAGHSILRTSTGGHGTG